MHAGRGPVVSEHCKQAGCKLFQTPRQSSQHTVLRKSAKQTTSHPRRDRPARLTASASASTPDDRGYSEPRPNVRQSLPAWSVAALTAAVPAAGLVAAALPAYAECGNGGGSNHNGGDGGDGGGDGHSGSDGRPRQHLFDVADDDDDQGGHSIYRIHHLQQSTLNPFIAAFCMPYASHTRDA